MKTKSTPKIHALLQRINELLPEEHRGLVAELAQQLELVDNNTDSSTQSALPKLDPSSGCYKFADDAGFYCPKCYDGLQQKNSTQRINRKLRVCTQCRASLKSTS
jgi:hypothetical protein